MEYTNDEFIRTFIVSAMAEDIGPGDFTTLASIPETARGTALLKIKDQGIIAGIDLAVKIFEFVEPTVHFTFFKRDGDHVKAGETAFSVSAKVHTLLSCERLVLNCMQRMSGIATKTFNLTQIIAGTRAKLLDTRKTTPNFRICEKWAVKLGGGENHRYGLFDMILLKDNHIDFAGGVRKAITAAKKFLATTGMNLKIEIETRTLSEVREALDTGGIDRILLDNMTPNEIKEAVKMIDGIFETEASGGISEENIREFAETGVNFISVGALTHSYKSLDMSLKADIR